jgi:hypothetical protein
MSYGLTAEVKEALEAKLSTRTDIVLINDVLSFQSAKDVKAKSTLTIPNAVPAPTAIAIINRHIENLNRSGGKFKPL